ncbi:sulfate adenylate transferase, large subunit/adenylylsulfate kinase [Heliomicrobium modesticaldum Ice1]|uniref:Multifunctional fusion protein n=1 Tax=Heliobacterium modesticaldum (strain ATCC 51547 / Ice1) TaxID=498761 RepID=B0THG8_HELMI|nr:sulfate adenylyltransferase subunit CysN [Heliomicrobium modesticaldum]ABZ83406.1 sulfate adenylate transferase, large subunit/adenylylsulfate kinase [Heliomicrobium modesticaldum Ice1]
MAAKQAKEITAFLEEQSRKDTLRFITCGSVDDGKSTLIGRLLYESKGIFDDQLKALEGDSKQYGTQGEKIDFALLVDGLQAEREQGITIDVAYRFFATDRRRYIVADTPGHEQYTRNMATGASTAQLAVILIDARKGVLTQTRRHSRIAAMMGIRHVVLAINKMDLVGFNEKVFRSVEEDYRAFSAAFTFKTIQAIPLSALEGDNVVRPSEHTPWYTGPTLMHYLDTLSFDPASERQAFRMPVQWVNRPHLDFRGFCGRIAEGEVRPGDAVRLLPSGVTSRVKEIIVCPGGLDLAQRGDAVTLTLTDEVDVSRGDVIASAEHPPEVADQFQARLIWMAEHPMVPGRPYLLKIHHKEVTATVTRIKYREEINTGAQLAANQIALNEIAVVHLSTSQPIVFEPYDVNRTLGGFILIDKLTFETVAAGMITFALRRSSNIHWHAMEIDKQARAELKHQRPRCLWFTGLSGSGKSTLANLLEKRLFAEGKHTYILDGDNVRHGLNRDLGFTEADRVENIRRVAEVAKLMVDAGLIVLVSFISPFRAERRMARQLFAEGEFIEIFVDTPLEECEKRDPKGLYAKARRGMLKNFTGIDSVYEPPESPEVHIKTMEWEPEASVDMLMRWLG